MARIVQTETAVRTAGSSLTFADVAEITEAVAARIGPAQGLRVLAILPDGVSAYGLHVGLLEHGGTLVPQSPATPPHQLLGIAERVRPGLVVMTAAIARKYRELTFGCPILIADDDAAPADWKLHGAIGSLARGPASDVRLILFTSGSTGEPKGVCLGRGALDAAARMNVEILGLEAGRRSLTTIPLFDYYGLIQIHSHLLAGSELILGPSVAFPSAVIDAILDAGVTDLVGVPFGLRRVFRAMDAERAPDLCTLRTITSSSEQLTQDVLRAVFAVSPAARVFDIYGLTEAGRSCSRVITAGDGASTAIGTPSRGVRISAGSSSGAPEELVIEGPNVMLGYLTGVTDDGTIEFEPRAEVRTGDLGYRDERGTIHLAGRSDHLLNVHGTLVHPSQLETVAFGCPGVVDARARMAVGTEPELILELVLDHAGADIDAVRRALRTELAPGLVPQQIAVVDAIPHTELGSKTVRGPAS